MQWMNLSQIKAALNFEKALKLQEEGFELYSTGKVTLPPVGYMNFGKEGGDLHIKCGWIQGDSVFAVKIAGAFYQNPKKHQLPSLQGVILVFDASTGRLSHLLQDEGYLTTLRTAMAGLIAAKYLAPKEIRGIGILGTGLQARLQAELLKRQTKCRDLWVFGRDSHRVAEYTHDMTLAGFRVFRAKTAKELALACNLIITATAAREPLLHLEDVQPGTHITALGADAPGKQELDPKLFQRADLIAVDSKSQCLDHGETSHPFQAGLISKSDIVELGEIIIDVGLARKSDSQVTIADLTGLGVQDIQIAKAVLAL